MTDDLTPAEEEVRRLLAEARHTEPVPDDVVARLDGVLAELAAEPARVAPVTQLAHRRRRAAGLLVAAAAVVVVGVGIGQVVDGGVQGGADSMTAGEAEDAGGAAAREDAPAEDFDTGSEPESASPGTGALADGRLVELQSRRFARDALRAQGNLSAYAVPELPAQASGGDVTSTNARGQVLDRALAAAITCHADAWGRGRFVPVRYDGAPAVLVFRKPSGDTQVADVYLCGGTVPERSVTLPAP